jgi:hypothetical protein
VSKDPRIVDSISIPDCTKPMTGRISCARPNQANTPKALSGDAAGTVWPFATEYRRRAAQVDGLRQVAEEHPVTVSPLRLSSNIRFAAAEGPDIVNENTITRGSLGSG